MAVENGDIGMLKSLGIKVKNSFVTLRRRIRHWTLETLEIDGDIILAIWQ